MSWVIDIYCKYAWVISLKDKKSITITNAFQKIFKESNRKPNRILVDKGSEFYNRSIIIMVTKEYYRNVFLEENLLWLNGSLEPRKIKSINTRLQFQEMFILMNQMI